MPAHAPPCPRRRALLRPLAACTLLAHLPPPALAHGSRQGGLVVDHAYALPTPPGARTAAVYLRRLANQGPAADRLLGAETPIASRAAWHRSALDERQVMRMQEVPVMELPAGFDRALRHGGEWHLMLEGLRAPLRDGDRFELTLRFERAGAVKVQVWVQQPRVRDAGHDEAHGRLDPAGPGRQA